MKQNSQEMQKKTKNSYDLISQNNEENLTEKVLRGRPFVFINTFPFEIVITLDNKKVAKIPGKTQQSISISVEKGQSWHVLYFYGKNSKLYEILRPEFVSLSTRTVRIGDVVYDTKDTSYYNSHADISGIRFHNRTTFPLQIFNKGRKIGETQPDDGTNFMSGLPNSVYLNNDGNGFRIGEEITFYLPHVKKVWSSIILNDNYVSDIYVGVINQKFNPPNPDTYNYRIDAPNHTGLTFYEPITGYITQKTNKNSII